MDSKEKVVVIGGGFAGINFVKKLDRKRYDVTLVDRNNYHSFPPLFIRWRHPDWSLQAFRSRSGVRCAR